MLLLPDGSRENGVRIVAAGQHRRLNDGSTDPAGRFLVGTLSLESRQMRRSSSASSQMDTSLCWTTT